MESEAKIILAFLFNRSGKTTLTEAEVYLPLSMELGWFSTKEAQEFITLALKQSLLRKEGKLLHPTFSVDTIAIPVGFTPSKKALQEKKVEHHEESLMGSIIDQICEKTTQDHKDVEEEIRHEAEEKDILPEVAALAVAWRQGVAITEWLDAVEAILLKGNTG
jgi:hypothetical protein